MDDVNAKLEIISNTLVEMGKQFKQIDKRFEQIDKRFEQIDKRFTELRTELKQDIASVETSLRDEIAALEHRTNVRFDELAAGQAQLAASHAALEANQADFKVQLTRLEERLFYEEGTRETQAEAIFDTSSQQYRQLDKRLRVVERQLKIKAA